MGEGGVQKIKIKPEKPFYTKGPISCELRPNKYKLYSPHVQTMENHVENSHNIYQYICFLFLRLRVRDC